MCTLPGNQRWILASGEPGFTKTKKIGLKFQKMVS
jgi:hypothetical protein